MKTILVACALVLSSALALAADNPWVGTWKLDPAKSRFTGESFTYTKGADGLLHYSDSSEYRYAFAIDGKEYKTFANRTTAWTADGDNAWTSITRQDGKPVFEARRELSADGRTMTVRAKGTGADGPALDTVSVFKRVAGGKGLVGTWRSTKVDVNIPDVVVISQPAPGVLRFESPSFKYVAEGKTDGTEFVPSGPYQPAGYTMSMRMLSPTKLSTAAKLDGKPDSYEEMTLAADGKSYTDVSWGAKAPKEKTKAVYVKQP